ncbi:MAG TPA: sterol desaturase family protein, partial [Caldimonas sp.]|nr:sterol desaturase family protein [Caldimonas sp.]
MQIERHGIPYRDARERARDYSEFMVARPVRELREQGARCMDCGVPFCHNGCPLGNLIPDWNDLVYRDRFKDAIAQLHATNNFPELTARLCPAPCEAACVLEIREGDAVTIKQIELAIIDRAWQEGWVVPQPPRHETGQAVAVVGSGPAGMAAAQQLRRAGHRVALFWAAHVVHHQSEDYNLSTALRQTSSGWLAGWLFYLPMALVGFPPLVFGVVALIDLLYQFWVHTEQIGKLGWFDRWFCAPSNHRVHHAVNDRYLDRNYGGVFIVWDRMFGTYAEEEHAEPCVYGTRAPLRSWNPVWANLQVYADLARDASRARRWSDKVRVWSKPPGWRPVDVAA